MKRAVEKLHSRRGASLIYALLLFLVASMVSVLVLSASVTAVKRLNDDRKQEQEYLLLSSAARLIKKHMESSMVTITTTTCEYTDDRSPDTTVDVAYENEGVLGAALENAVKNRNGPSPLEKTDGSITVVTGNAGDADFDSLQRNAELKFSMKTKRGEEKDYPISGTVQLQNGSQKIYFSAYVSNLTYRPPSRPPLLETHDITTTVTITTEDGKELTETVKIGTETITRNYLKWDVTLSTNPPKTEVTP